MFSDIVLEGSAKILEQPEYSNLKKAKAMLEFLDAKEELVPALQNSDDMNISIKIGKDNGVRHCHHELQYRRRYGRQRGRNRSDTHGLFQSCVGARLSVQNSANVARGREHAGRRAKLGYGCARRGSGSINKKIFGRRI